MWCPKCYGSMKKKEGVCIHCGFKLSEFNGATNEKAREAFRNGKREDVLYTNNLPIDVSKKSLLLLSIFLGVFGAHNYYCAKFGKAIYMTITTVFMLLFALFKQFNIGGWFVTYFFSFVALLQGVTLLMWVVDIVYIIFNKFKVPVYKEEFSK